MKKNSLIVLLLFFISSIAQAQDKNAYYNAVDYCNCKLAFAYAQKYANTHVGSKEEKSFNSIQSKLNCKIDKPLLYDSLTDLLKRNNFGSYVINSAIEFKQMKEISPESFTKEQAVKQIIDGIFSDQKLSSVITQTGFAKQKEALTSELSKYFAGKFPNETKTETVTTPVETKAEDATPKVTIEDLQTQIESLKQQLDDNVTHWYSPNWISIIICIALFAIIFFMFGGSMTDLKERVDRYRNEEKSSGIRQNTNWNQSQSSNNNSREWLEFKKTIERTVGDMSDAISRMQNTITFWENSNSPKQESFSDQQSNIPKQERETVYYASFPNSDGTFNNSSLIEEINPTESFYKLTLKDSNKASFEFLSDERAAKHASSSPELILYPVCKMKNSPTQNVKRIKTITPGIVVKRNDKWEMESPALIEYE